MAPIYTSKPLASRTIQSPAYTQRGLKDNVASLEDVPIVGHPETIQPQYPQYIANLSAFIAATASQRKITCGGTYNPTIDLEIVLPLTLPSLTIAPTQAFPNTASEEVYLAKIPRRFTPITYLKRKCFVVNDLSFSDLPKMPASDSNVPCTSDSVSIRGLRQLGTTLKLITLFLATHTYPAFQTQNDGDHTHGDFASDMDLYHPAKIEREIGFRGRYRHYTTEEGKRLWNDDDQKVMPELDGYPAPENTHSSNGSVFVAKPAPLYPKVNYGPANTIPNYPGYVLPYFPGICFPSKVNIVAIMRRFFYGSFGATIAHRQTNWKEWETCVDKWCRTETGIEIAHILTCLQTALEAQGRLYVILNGRKYLGCAILGFRFHISKFGVLCEPDTEEGVRECANELDEHSRAIAQIQTTLAGIELKGEDDVRMDVVVNTSSARMIHREIEVRRTLTEDEEGTIRDSLKDVTFNQRFWTIGGETVKKAIDMIVSDDPIPPDWPMYLSPTCFKDQSRIFKVLSAFGPTAPSLVDSNGDDIKLPAGIEADDPMSRVPAGETIIKMPKLFVCGKLLHIATNDMKGVFNKRRIKQNFKERAGGYRTIAVSGKLRDDLWTALKMIPVKVEPQKRKRGREEDEEEDASRKKGRGDGQIREDEIITSI